MQAKRILTTAALVVAAMLIIGVPAANATNYTWQGGVSGSETDWGTANNWSPSAVPNGSGDTVTIGDRTYDPVLDQNRTIGSVTIQNNGILKIGANTLTISSSNGLTIDAGGLLNVDSGSGVVILSGGGTSQTVNGELRLTAGGSTLRITSSCTIDGDGSIDGQNDTAAIEIAANVTLTSTTTIKGNLQITETSGGPANTAFVNDGTVRANNASGTLELNVDSLDPATGGPTGDWEVSASNAVLWLRIGSTAMTSTSDFTVSDGTLKIDDDVTTTGNLSFTGGTVDVAASKSYQAS